MNLQLDVINKRVYNVDLDRYVDQHEQEFLEWLDGEEVEKPWPEVLMEDFIRETFNEYAEDIPLCNWAQFAYEDNDYEINF